MTLQEEIDAIHWFHQIDLGNGIVTPGIKRTSSFTIPPHCFAGKTVLDIGAWDGYYSFYAERCGAKSVLAVDKPAWTSVDDRIARYATFTGKSGFNLCHRVLKSKVKSRTLSLQEIDVHTAGRHDVVLLLGVIYHLLDPLVGIRTAARVCDQMLIVETVVTPELSVDVPAMMFYDAGQHRNDETTFFAPTPACVSRMLGWCGFKRVEWEFTSNPCDADMQVRIDETRAIFYATP